MNRRNGETPMEFEWQSGAGPMDATSGFAKLAMKHQSENTAKKRKNKITSSLLTALADIGALAPGNHSIFDSPTKPLTPSLRTPASQTFLFSKPLPPHPVYDNPSFTTPRKIDTDFCSSGPENESSPEHNADSDATPDMGFRSALAKTGSAFSQFGVGATSHKEREKKTSSAVSKLASPGKGEIARRPYSNAIEKRARKNRQRDAQLQRSRRRSSSASDSEDNNGIETSNPKSTSKTPAPPSGPSTLSSLFSFIERHPNLPHILSFYAQLLLNLFLVFFFIYIIYSFWSTIRSDVDKKSEEAITETLAEMAVCAQNYRENRCERESRVPAMEAVCNNWEKCMNKDPRAVGRARVSAHTFAEIFNGFIEPISYKAMIFILLSLFGSIAISNFAFGFFRNKALSHFPTAHPMYTYAGQPPPTPHRQFSGQQEFYPPYHAQGAHEPGPSMGALEPQSPVRRLQYR